MQDASIYAVHHCFCGFGEVIPFNILTPTGHGSYQRNGLTESVIVIPHFKSQDAKINMTSPIYKAANQDPLYVQIEPFDSFNDYFISRKFVNLDNTTPTVNMVKTLGVINNHGNTGSQQRYILQLDDCILELPLNISTTTGLGARIASTNYGEVRVGEILFRTGNPDKLIFSRRKEAAEYFALKVVNLVFIRQLENMRFKFPESPEQELRAMSHVNTLRRMNPNATEFNHLIKLFAAMNDNSCLYIMTPYCNGGSLQDLIAANYPKGVPEHIAKRWFNQIVSGIQYYICFFIYVYT
jgi:serine/threonine protein kinase